MRSGIVFACALLAAPPAASAGMPSMDLTDVAKLRLQSISFFLVGALGAAWVVQRLWNSLHADFPRWPPLTYGRAVAIVGLWGLLFIIVLTMISGARELMTPGAWEKRGLTYQLASEGQAQPVASREDENLLDQRRRAVERLQVELLRFAARHNGRYPTSEEWEMLPDDVRRVPQHVGVEYRYVPELTAESGEAVLAWEPFVYDDERALAILADGGVVRMTADRLGPMLPDEGAGR